MRYTITIDNINEEIKEKFCQFASKLQLKYTVESFKPIFDEVAIKIAERQASCNSHAIEFSVDLKTGVCFWCGIKNNKPIFGAAKCRKDDTFNKDIGFYLAVCRAHGWKDLEKELLDAIE